MILAVTALKKDLKGNLILWFLLNVKERQMFVISAFFMIMAINLKPVCHKMNFCR